MLTWSQRIHERLNGRESNVPWRLLDKLALDEWCRVYRVPAPNILQVFDSPAAIDLSPMKSNFVLKPTRQSSSKGVMVLSRIRGGLYREYLKCRELTERKIVSQQAELFSETGDILNKIIAEDIVYDLDGNCVPVDYKAYTFYDRVRFVLRVDRNTKPPSITWFGEDFRPLRPGAILSNPKFVTEKRHEKPESFSALIELAETTCRELGTPFARIDMYNSTSGPLLGEITLTPGGLYFGQHFQLSTTLDHELGQLWKRAHVRLRDAG